MRKLQGIGMVQDLKHLHIGRKLNGIYKNAVFYIGFPFRVLQVFALILLVFGYAIITGRTDELDF
jgi:hypothetical protein